MDVVYKGIEIRKISGSYYVGLVKFASIEEAEMYIDFQRIENREMRWK